MIPFAGKPSPEIQGMEMKKKFRLKQITEEEKEGVFTKMMKADTLFPIDIELCITGSNKPRREQVWLTKGQYEVLEIVTRALDQSI
jgi:hypothetical protein